MSIITALINKHTDINSIADMVLADNAILSELLEGINSSQDQIRYNSFNVIMLISENYPELLYPQWSLFETMLDSDNRYFKLIPIQIIANLIKIDTNNRFERVFNKYFSALYSEKVMVAAPVASNAGKIALAKPNLQSKITDKLVNINAIYNGKQIDLVKGYAIEAFSQYFNEATVKDKDRILEFVRKEQTSRSPRTRKIAAEFLKKWG